MTTTVNAENIFKIINLESVFRMGLVLALVVYVIFALLVIRQTTLMSQVLHNQLSPVFKSFAFLHFIVSLLILIMVLLLFMP